MFSTSDIWLQLALVDLCFVTPPPAYLPADKIGHEKESRDLEEEMQQQCGLRDFRAVRHPDCAQLCDGELLSLRWK